MRFLAVSGLTDDRVRERMYVLHWVRHPDEGSEFDKKSGQVRSLPDEQIIPTLLKFGYDGILLVADNGEVIGHAFFQKHPEFWGVFSVVVRKEFRNQGYAKKLAAEMLCRAHRELAPEVRLSAGGSEVMTHIWNLAAEGKLGLGFQVVAGQAAGVLRFAA